VCDRVFAGGKRSATLKTLIEGARKERQVRGEDSEGAARRSWGLQILAEKIFGGGGKRSIPTRAIQRPRQKRKSRKGGVPGKSKNCGSENQTPKKMRVGEGSEGGVPGGGKRGRGKMMERGPFAKLHAHRNLYN